MIGASAGGLAPLRELFAGLPADYGAAIFVVMHVAPETPSVLPAILDRLSALPVGIASAGAPVRPGTAMIAPPDMHLLLDHDRVRLVNGPRENRHRPSIDVLFRSAALAYGPRVTGVVLSGMKDDGAAGLWAIKRRGGAAVVQEPSDAEYPEMPRSAMDIVDVDACVPARDLASTLIRLVAESPAKAKEPAPVSIEAEARMIEQNNSSMAQLDALGQPVPLTCPECGGALWEIQEGGPRFRCHTGHAYSLATLADEQSIEVEAALWAALRRLEESERVAQRMASYARVRGNASLAAYHADIASGTAAHAATLRQLLGDRAVPRETNAADENAADD
ncbi:MAG TPA: chemotaxis protein CheB [Casimicrobiaceae bacterium]|nr:chemotaxis protein CheB [Casimicrobiaceae bacterium]